MNLYDIKQMKYQDYSWNEKGRKTAGHYITWRWIITILILIGIIYAQFSGAFRMLSFQGVVLELLAFVALDMAGLIWIAGFYRRKRRKLEPEAQHDFLLRIYQWNRHRSITTDNLALLGMAEIKAACGEYGACRNALSLVKTKKLQQPDLKLYYKLQMDAAAAMCDAAEEEWRARFTGIQGEIPKERKVHNVRIGLLFLFASYLLAYRGLSSGLEEPYELRMTFQLCSEAVIALGGVVICGFLIFRIWKRYKTWKQEQQGRNITMILLMLLLWIVLLLFLILGGGGMLSVPEEREIRTDDTYVYLEVSYGTGYYSWQAKADNPFIRETYYDTSISKRTDSIDENDTETDIMNEDQTDTALDSDNSENESTEVQQYETEENEMNALWQYLVQNSLIEDQGFATQQDAKGFTYAVVGTNQGARLVLKNNGDQMDEEGNACTEYVLEKEDETQTELLGFYLVNRSTLEVTDEHKTN